MASHGDGFTHAFSERRAGYAIWQATSLAIGVYVYHTRAMEAIMLSYITQAASAAEQVSFFNDQL
jgi:hypothetical protein